MKILSKGLSKNTFWIGRLLCGFMWGSVPGDRLWYCIEDCGDKHTSYFCVKNVVRENMSMLVFEIGPLWMGFAWKKK